MIPAGTDSPAAAGVLRQHNTALVLRALRDAGPLSRTDLARRTGLAKATVGTIGGRLLAAGAVEEQDSFAGARGRPSRPLALSGARYAALGIEANVDYLAVVAVDLSGQTLLSEEQPVEAVTPDTIVTAAADAVSRLADDRRSVVGVTAAVPGLVDTSRNRVEYAPNLRWRDVELTTLVRDALGGDVSVAVDNDANCAAFAEARHGVAQGVPDVLYLTGTTGIGAGIVSAGEIVRGGAGYAGEVGHMRIGDPQQRCACGRHGCWEAVIGLPAMVRAVGGVRPSAADPVSVAIDIADEAASDLGVRNGLAELGDWLAAGSAVLANALNPSMIVLGGYFVPLGEWLLPRVRAALETEVFGSPECRAELSTLGLRAAATGAAAQSLDAVFAGRTPLR
ncbi:ROK family transcriptional regulator [Nocardioidaceae bacterium SCSIO 66511]|nr:ROK family transcriptional regulator [Nocardioidaceae bacterium SCSIO 66511]